MGWWLVDKCPRLKAGVYFQFSEQVGKFPQGFYDGSWLDGQRVIWGKIRTACNPDAIHIHPVGSQNICIKRVSDHDDFFSAGTCFFQRELKDFMVRLAIPTSG